MLVKSELSQPMTFVKERIKQISLGKISFCISCLLASLGWRGVKFSQFPVTFDPSARWLCEQTGKFSFQEFDKQIVFGSLHPPLYPTRVKERNDFQSSIINRMEKLHPQILTKICIAFSRCPLTHFWPGASRCGHRECKPHLHADDLILIVLSCLWGMSFSPTFLG